MQEKDRKSGLFYDYHWKGLHLPVLPTKETPNSGCLCWLVFVNLELGTLTDELPRSLITGWYGRT